MSIIEPSALKLNRRSSIHAYVLAVGATYHAPSQHIPSCLRGQIALGNDDS